MSDAILLDLKRSALIAFRLYVFGTFEFQWLGNLLSFHDFCIEEFLWCDFDGEPNFRVVAVQLVE